MLKALRRDSSVTSPARLPTKRRKWAGSHSSRDGSCHVWPPPLRTTVFCFPSAPVMTAATPVSAFAADVMAELLMVGPTASGRKPRGPELAPVPTPPMLLSPNLLNARAPVREESESLLA